MSASIADVLRKHREALQGLLHQAWEESELLVTAMLTSDVSEVVRDNADNLRSILYSLYACNSENATSEQWVQLKRLGFVDAASDAPGVEILRDSLHEFDGYAVDLFKTESGALGLTIERAPAREDNPSLDIFVSRDLKVTVAGLQ